jgi:hypothetical protein
MDRAMNTRISQKAGHISTSLTAIGFSRAFLNKVVSKIKHFVWGDTSSARHRKIRMVFKLRAPAFRASRTVI